MFSWRNKKKNYVFQLSGAIAFAVNIPRRWAFAWYKSFATMIKVNRHTSKERALEAESLFA